MSQRADGRGLSAVAAEHTKRSRARFARLLEHGGLPFVMASGERRLTAHPGDWRPRGPRRGFKGRVRAIGRPKKTPPRGRVRTDGGGTENPGIPLDAP